MNERILELAKQIWPDPTISHTNHIKFAELIVAECARELDERTVFVRGHRAGTWIKRHFGVEESKG